MVAAIPSETSLTVLARADSRGRPPLGRPFAFGLPFADGPPLAAEGFPFDERWPPREPAGVVLFRRAFGGDIRPTIGDRAPSHRGRR